MAIGECNPWTYPHPSRLTTRIMIIEIWRAGANGQNGHLAFGEARAPLWNASPSASGPRRGHSLCARDARVTNRYARFLRSDLLYRGVVNTRPEPGPKTIL
ncbi:hypothetical protein EVAR_102607_1 [Eumeta japonica]|uniref:Uncharacterized protein n=1 Tax=Eumeta variegata TaxID=151549 RepID=A0A4C1TUR5_EUMVA|nr:hypothetical protein EVAR_102607_1 [Eumeta japonica]